MLRHHFWATCLIVENIDSCEENQHCVAPCTQNTLPKALLGSVTQMHQCWLAHVKSCFSVTGRPPTGLCVWVTNVRVQMPQVPKESGWCFRASRQPWNAHVCLSISYLSNPHAEFNWAAREQCRRQSPGLGYPPFTCEETPRERERERAMEGHRKSKGGCFGILRR